MNALATEDQRVYVVVWDIAPSPILSAGTFSVKVGVKNSNGANLAGQEILLRNGDGQPVASACLYRDIWPGTAALYWTELCAVAPIEVGQHAWSAEVIGHESRPAWASLHFAVENRPQHLVKVYVVDRKTMHPTPDVEIRMASFAARTDALGVAVLGVPTGTFRLSAVAETAFSSDQQLDVESDFSVTVFLEIVQEDLADSWC